jgi:hypothetical protein
VKSSFVLTSALTASVAWAAVFAPGEARACAPAPPPGVEVQIAGESALIVWDAARKVEHFVRRARFVTRGAPAADFGFLVPTPTKPELAEASPELFRALEKAIEPEVIRETRTSLQPTCLCLAPLLMTAGKPRSASDGARRVDVLDEVTVAGYEAAVLAANDAGALAEWLKQHGYDERPALRDWLELYVRQGWIITAFKVTGQATAPVRLSFPSERPFYPYREPVDARATAAGATPPPRSLRVFFVGLERVRGTIGDGGATSWPGALEYAQPLGRAAVANLLGPNVPALPEGGDLWLQAFLDESSPRPGTDEVFFPREESQATHLPPPVVIRRTKEVPLPLDPLLLLGVGAFLVRRSRRRAAAAARALPQKGDA